MATKFSNNASATLASSITNVATSIAVTAGQGALFPTLSAGEFFYATLVDSSNNLEIVKVTARATDTLTVVRAQDGTAARAYTAGDKLELRVVAASFGTFAQTDQAQTFSAVQTFSQTIVGSINGSSASCSGNAATVTNGVYTTGNQTIGGAKVFSSKIEVNNTVADDKLDLRASGSAPVTVRYYQAGIFEWWTGMLSGSSTFRIGNGAGFSSTLYQFDGSGNFTANGNVTAYSDERLKKDWASVGIDFISKLAQVKSGTYTRIDNDLRQAGVSAQSLQTVLPETVMEDVEGNLSVAYGNAALVSAVELAKKVVELQARLEALESK